MTVRSLALGAIIALTAGPAQAGSLSQEIEYLLQTHPQINAARNEVSAATEGVKSAFSEYLPQMTLFSDYGYQKTDSPGLRAVRNGRDLDTTRDKVTVTITQNLFDGFRRETNNETARLNRTVAEIDLDATRQQVFFEASSAYLNVLRHSQLIDFAVRNEHIIQIQLNLEDERVQRGAGISVDVLQAKSRLQIAKERRIAFEGNLKNAVTRYTQVFGRPPEMGSMMLPPLPVDQVPATLTEAEEAAAAENPTAINSQRAIDIARQRKRGARSPYYPRFDLVGEYNFEQDDEGVLGTRRDYTIKVQANWELFSGFSTRADSAEAAFRYLATIDNNAFVDRKVLEDVRLAWEQLDTTRARVELLENAVNIAIEVHDARQKLREAGKETVMNVLDAENEVFNAQISLVDAEFDGRIALYRLVAALGRLTPGALIEAASVEPDLSFVAWAAGAGASSAAADEEMAGVAAKLENPMPAPVTAPAAPARLVTTPAPPTTRPSAPPPVIGDGDIHPNFQRFWSFE